MESCSLIHLKRNGAEGSSFPLTTNSTLVMGRLVFFIPLIKKIFFLLCYCSSVVPYLLLAEIQSVISEFRFQVLLISMSNLLWIMLERCFFVIVL